MLFKGRINNSESCVKHKNQKARVISEESSSRTTEKQELRNPWLKPVLDADSENFPCYAI